MYKKYVLIFLLSLIPWSISYDVSASELSQSFRCMLSVLSQKFISFAGAPSRAHQDAKIHGLGAEDRKLILAKLKELPMAQEMVWRMLMDPEIPRNIIQILKKVILEEDALILRLDQKLRKELNLRSSFGAAQVTRDSPFVLKNEFAEPTVNELATKQSKIPDGGPKYEVLVQNREITEHYNDLVSLFHEMAHARFHSFIASNLENLLERWPDKYIKKREDGTIEIYRLLYDFLSERYAHQIEFEVLWSTYGEYYESFYGRYKDVNLDNYRQLISGYILRKYTVKDPEISSLKDYTISEILLGNPFRGKEIE